MEIIAYKNLHNKRFNIAYWRTKTGLEVDFILGDTEEVKISSLVGKSDIKGLTAFCEEHSPRKAMVVSQDDKPRKITTNETTKIDVLPWKIFLDKLWLHKLTE